MRYILRLITGVFFVAELMIYLQPLVDQGKSSWNIPEFVAALHVWRPSLPFGFNISSILHAPVLCQFRFPLGRSFSFKQLCANQPCLRKDHAKMQRCLPWFFRTEPESEDFAYWDDDGMKVLHCDHTFELRSQESSLLLH